MDLKGAPSDESLDQARPSSVATFADSCTLHGIRHIFSPGGLSVRRLLWLLAFLGSLSLLVLQSLDRVQYYLRYPCVTKQDEVSTPLTVFPAVTLCNLNEFRFSRMTRNDLYHAGELLALLDERMEIVEPRFADAQVIAQLRKHADFRVHKPRPFSMREFYERAGHELREMLLHCKFHGMNCTPQDFQTVYTRYGKCYTFNSGKDGRPLLTSMKGGMGNGLEMMLDIQQDEYLPVWGETDETSFEAGIKVQIHSQDEPPFIDQLGFGVAPGFQTFVSCQEQRLTYLPYPWGDCKDTPPESEFFDTYSIAACQIDCETRYLVENCNCRMVHMPGDAPYCTPEQYKECANPALMFLVEKDDDYCACEMPCNIKRYAKELSMVKIPSQASAKYLAKKFNKTEAYIAENVLVLDIFFEALNYETIEQKRAYEVAGLLGDIGGHMGLFIGASILTILEIFDYLYEIIKYRILYYFCRNKKQRNISDNSVPMTSSYAAPQGHTQAAIHPHGAHAKYEDFTC
ncbi:acid-sensing ion channel 1-like isoform X2 [Petromyzon marinus]|uniref:Acid-sensing ion channel 1-like isoform X2 n=1 Tax=Petromyzon marinus TaxID=7757 RepID=A0AAJ7TLG2_PETMA|nr:acid-sensing ion channel 1-like isoform X2 [Petromyzon marinus]XP_032819024.1 acid-sensing ion channel 1-like isoform X2 [Petromyzon marinus]XP_032819035.1 acid-sensing ion channel 1-like isoform X2 [Petromyzon marinus]